MTREERLADVVDLAAERQAEEDADELWEIANYGSDAAWFKATGNCGGCGSAVNPADAGEGFPICTCRNCGCGPHPPLDARKSVEDTTLPMFDPGAAS